MKWLKRAVRNWLREDEISVGMSRPVISPDDPNNEPFSLSVSNALNGKVIQIRTYQPQARGPDWRHEFYIVPEGENLTEAVAILLMAKNLEKA